MSAASPDDWLEDTSLFPIESLQFSSGNVLLWQRRDDTHIGVGWEQWPPSEFDRAQTLTFLTLLYYFPRPLVWAGMGEETTDHE